jgi:hypothetical protein
MPVHHQKALPNHLGEGRLEPRKAPGRQIVRYRLSHPVAISEESATLKKTANAVTVRGTWVV